MSLNSDETNWEYEKQGFKQRGAGLQYISGIVFNVYDGCLVFCSLLIIFLRETSQKFLQQTSVPFAAREKAKKKPRVDEEYKAKSFVHPELLQQLFNRKSKSFLHSFRLSLYVPHFVFNSSGEQTNTIVLTLKRSIHDSSSPSQKDLWLYYKSIVICWMRTRIALNHNQLVLMLCHDDGFIINLW